MGPERLEPEIRDTETLEPKRLELERLEPKRLKSERKAGQRGLLTGSQSRIDWPLSIGYTLYSGQDCHWPGQARQAREGWESPWPGPACRAGQGRAGQGRAEKKGTGRYKTAR